MVLLEQVEPQLNLDPLTFVCSRDLRRIVYPSFIPREPSPNSLVAPGHTLFTRFTRNEGVPIWGKDVLESTLRSSWFT